MFGWFKSKTQKEKLQLRYQKLTAEAYKLSHSNRKLSDEKLAKAEEVMKMIDQMQD